MRFLCIIGILLFLTLEDTEGATHASCIMEIKEWWILSKQHLKTCHLNISAVNDEDFTISSPIDRLTFGLHLQSKAYVKSLPTNVYRVFPDLVAFKVIMCSVTTIRKSHFRNLSKLNFLHLHYNKIEHVAGDAFADLVSLRELFLHNNRIQSLSANTFSSLKVLKQLYLDDNEIRFLDPNIFKLLVEVHYIRLYGNLIATLDGKIFESLTNLTGISLQSNKLKNIPRNLFQYNLKLRGVTLNHNEINFIDANMFDHLPNLANVFLESNLCVNKNYDKSSFHKMRSDLKQSCSAACGSPRRPLSLIHEGKNFTRGAFPWMVALMLTKSRPAEFWGAGVLISDTFVISAAHCILNKGAVSEFLPRDFIAIFGAHDLNNHLEVERIVLSPTSIFIHEDWNHQTMSYDADISFLKFENGRISFSDYIQPICLWNSETDPTVTTGVVTGWGKSRDTTKLHENLPKMIPAPILTNEDCWMDDRGMVDLLSRRTFCSGLNNGSGVCQGDSGGGLFIEVGGIFYLRGIVSSSKITDQGCDVSRKAVYTNLLKFRDWIKKKLE